jgi:hypothetical protein
MVQCGKTLHKQYSGKIAHLTINKVFPIARASGGAVAAGEKFGGECKWPVIYCNQLQERRHVSEQKLSRCSLFIAQGAINLHPPPPRAPYLCGGAKRVRGPPLRKHISQLAALSGNSSPLPSLSLLCGCWLRRELQKSFHSREMLVVIDRGERCKFDAAGSALAPMLFGNERERE